jgi:hypothetical protein
MISEENRQIVQEYAQSLFDEVWVDYGFLKDKKMKPLDEDKTKTIIDRIMVQVTEHNMRSLSKPKILVLSTPAYKELGEYMKIHYNYCFNSITVDARGYFVVNYCLGMDVAELVKPTNEIEIHVI